MLAYLNPHLRSWSLSQHTQKLAPSLPQNDPSTFQYPIIAVVSIHVNKFEFIYPSGSTQAESYDIKVKQLHHPTNLASRAMAPHVTYY